jgi:hypothetical protein
MSSQGSQDLYTISDYPVEYRSEFFCGAAYIFHLEIPDFLIPAEQVGVSNVPVLKCSPGHSNISKFFISGPQLGDVDQGFGEALPTHWVGGPAPKVALACWLGLFLLVQ